jgi:hypothetical protein
MPGEPRNIHGYMNKELRTETRSSPAKSLLSKMVRVKKQTSIEW